MSTPPDVNPKVWEPLREAIKAALMVEFDKKFNSEFATMFAEACIRTARAEDHSKWVESVDWYIEGRRRENADTLARLADDGAWIAYHRAMSGSSRTDDLNFTKH
jgi:hypothetical protein